MTKSYHMTLDVEGILTNWNDRMLSGLFIDHHTKMSLTATEAKEYLIECLKEGKEVIPLNGEPCEGFDYKKGCPGHPLKATKKQAI